MDSFSSDETVKVMELLAFWCGVAESLYNLGADQIKIGRPSTDRLENEFLKKKKKGPCVNIPVPDVRKDGVGHLLLKIGKDASILSATENNLLCVKSKVHLC